VTFLSRAFSTKPAKHTAEASDFVSTIATSGTAVQGQDQNVQTLHGLPRQRFKQHGNAVIGDEQCEPVGRSPVLVQHNDVHTQTDCVDAGKLPLKEASTVKATRSLPMSLRDSNHEDQQGAPSASANGIVLSSATDDVAESVSDDDYMSTSSESEQDGSEVEEADEEPSETHTPLKFQIPEDVLQAAVTAPENTKASFWSSTLYRGPDDAPVLVHYCKTKEVAERVAKHFVKKSVVGFDIEWKPYSSPDSIKKNVSLIQLACEDRIALFHVALFQGNTARQLVPPTLRAILESPDIYKVGVAIKGDFSRVSKFLKIEAQGVYELSRLHNLVEHFATDPSRVNNKLVALAPQVQQHLGLPLYKGGHLIDDPEDLNNVRSSDWSLALNRQQIHYAAADAYAGFRLFDVLEEKRKLLKPTPPRPSVCDYDAKPKPRPTVSKPRKKRTPVAKDKETATAIAEELVAATEQTGEPEEEPEQKSERSQDTEGYETAQEDLLDSHQLEGEEPASSEHSYESTDESNDDTLPDPDSSLENAVDAPVADVDQKRIGRINLSRLRSPDPGYPKLPELRGGDGGNSTSDDDLVDISERLEEVKIDRKDKSSIVSKENQDEGTDEFDDSELEEALQDLSIDSDGELQEFTTEAAIEPGESSEQLVPTVEDSTELRNMQPSKVADVQAESSPNLDDSAFEKEEQQLADPTSDPEVAVYPHELTTAASAPAVPVPAQPSASEPSTPSPVTSIEPASEHAESALTPEYTIATTWARSYLSSTIPSPDSLTPSHIRATVPHLRAYHMWHHQHLALSEIAAQLRDPPLTESTVGSYVLQAITLERMEYDASAVRGVLMGMPEALRRGKWRGFAEKVGAR
jgi:hypothetical protein